MMSTRRSPPGSVWLATIGAEMLFMPALLSGVGAIAYAGARPGVAGDLLIQGWATVLWGLAVASLTIGTLLGRNLWRRSLIVMAVLLLPFGGVSLLILLPLLSESAIQHTSPERRWQRSEYVAGF